jgi:uncharacterized protein with FMN-binding domain
MAKKMSRPLVALSASAIAAIYLSGVAVTHAADTALATGTPGGTATVAASSSAGASGLSAPSVTAYRDGTYSGTGTSRRGNVTVSVAISGGRISNVSITNVTTQYPVSRISSLPGQVIASQSSQVNSVSGATYSAQAFRLGVQAALQHASA